MVDLLQVYSHDRMIDVVRGELGKPWQKNFEQKVFMHVSPSSKSYVSQLARTVISQRNQIFKIFDLTNKSPSVSPDSQSSDISPLP